VASESCKLNIQSTDAHCVRDNRNKECEEKGYIGAFSATQCSGVCTYPAIEDFAFPDYESWSVIKDVIAAEFIPKFRHGPNGKILVIVTYADRIDLTAKYFNKYGNQYGSDSRVEYDTGLLEIGYHSSGMCGVGEAEDGNSKLEFHTEAGNARGNC